MMRLADAMLGVLADVPQHVAPTPPRVAVCPDLHGAPLEPQIARDFAAGLDEIVVAEEKGPFVERLLKEVLYGAPDAPRILGKRDEQGEALRVPHADGTLAGDERLALPLMRARRDLSAEGDLRSRRRGGGRSAGAIIRSP